MEDRQIITAMPAQQKLVPLYEVHTIKDRKRTKTVYERVPVKGGKDGQTEMRSTVVEEVLPVSYMVYFPHGHSIAFESIEQMKAAGVSADNHSLVDLETGDVVNMPQQRSLRSRSEALESLGGNRRTV